MASKKLAVYVISVAAELAGVHPQTLRIYERRGLINPYRTPGGTRRYSQADIERLELIQELTDQGLNLEGVKRVLDLRERISRLEEDLATIKSALDNAIEEAGRQIAEVHRSYRRDIVLRRHFNPDVTRRDLS
ncbi:MAG: helix-turn-helix transcriptional regulator [Acidimicrobiia bacterium]